MEILNLLFVAFIVAAPISVGAIAVLFSRRFSLSALRWRKAVWKMGYTEFDIKVGQVYAVVLGAVVLLSGLIGAARLVLP
jgi:hypothetical protein